MPTAVHPAVAPAVRPAPRAATVPLFAAALFLSALLLFAVQPMFTKMVLPVLGGSPAVWSIALVFFQALLLADYCYAHLLGRYASTRAALALHLALMLGAGLSLPIAIPAGWTSAPADGEAFWLLGLFAVSVGLPFFALAATGPCCRPGSRAPVIRAPPTRISSTPPRMSARLRPSSPIRSRSSPSSGCRSRPQAGSWA